MILSYLYVVINYKKDNIGIPVQNIFIGYVYFNELCEIKFLLMIFINNLK